MTTVPQDPMGKPEMAGPDFSKKNPITGKGQVDSYPPHEGVGPLGQPVITAKGPTGKGGTPLDSTK